MREHSSCSFVWLVQILIWKLSRIMWKKYFVLGLIKDNSILGTFIWDCPWSCCSRLNTPCTGENDPMGSSIEKITIWVRKLCLWVQNPQCLPDVFLTFISLHFAPIRSVVQNPHCHFSMDEPIGFPVQGETVSSLDSHYFHKLGSMGFHRVNLSV